MSASVCAATRFAPLHWLVSTLFETVATVLTAPLAIIIAVSHIGGVTITSGCVIACSCLGIVAWSSDQA